MTHTCRITGLKYIGDNRFEVTTPCGRTVEVSMYDNCTIPGANRPQWRHIQLAMQAIKNANDDAIADGFIYEDLEGQLPVLK